MLDTLRVPRVRLASLAGQPHQPTSESYVRQEWSWRNSGTYHYRSRTVVQGRTLIIFGVFKSRGMPQPIDIYGYPGIPQKPRIFSPCPYRPGGGGGGYTATYSLPYFYTHITHINILGVFRGIVGV